ncbi:uncharacterized protein BP01DRAFT_369189 [Aspergillus saccharolyticus JOP 1030-1]|uniref:Uncharacterized protein n=1 Tax=Aspergillus saccharolyticus JOP 1030-1 TaxID=1450539 RepID=A0A318Z4E0_9EURO|nr:hypothetical protein BP01DRAFT_369189 [Aspergillus saccharolyticus JOP 1030-1]PYH41294.1 hypothetical protein BP01DRAFT_369189 [Aspergillus saccharolyticus JOP 1030-1]
MPNPNPVRRVASLMKETLRTNATRSAIWLQKKRTGQSSSSGATRPFSSTISSDQTKGRQLGTTMENTPQNENNQASQTGEEHRLPLPLVMLLETLLSREDFSLAMTLADEHAPEVVYIVVDGPEQLPAEQQQQQQPPRWMIDRSYRDNGKALVIDRDGWRTQWTRGEELFVPEIYDGIAWAAEAAITSIRVCYPEGLRWTGLVEIYPVRIVEST